MKDRFLISPIAQIDLSLSELMGVSLDVWNASTLAVETVSIFGYAGLGAPPCVGDAISSTYIIPTIADGFILKDPLLRLKGSFYLDAFQISNWILDVSSASGGTGVFLLPYGVVTREVAENFSAAIAPSHTVSDVQGNPDYGIPIGTQSNGVSGGAARLFVPGINILMVPVKNGTPNYVDAFSTPADAMTRVLTGLEKVEMTSNDVLIIPNKAFASVKSALRFRGVIGAAFDCGYPPMGNVVV